MVKYITLCADDYGQNPEISQAIVELIQKKSLSATSCMTSTPYWPEYSKILISLNKPVDIGLHFNLTEGPPLVMKGFDSLKNLVTGSLLGRLDKAAIEEELNAQIDQFVAGIGRLPDFMDGHQHIHQLPIIRDILIQVYHKRLKSNKTYIRSLFDPEAYYRFHSTAYFKQNIIQMLGASAFKKLLIANHIPHNSSFAGVYSFAHSKNYSRFFLQFLKQITDGGLIMCHPGGININKNDRIAKSRLDEYRFFLSDLFIELNKQSEVIIARFNQKK